MLPSEVRQVLRQSLQFPNATAAPNCAAGPSAGLAAQLLVWALGRFLSAQGRFRVPAKTLCEIWGGTVLLGEFAGAADGF